MIYENWMSYIKDDVKINKLVIPGAHNAGSYPMAKMACCQDGDFYTQASFGIRHFCIRLNTDKNGTIVMAHGISKGKPLEDALKQFSKMLKDFGSEIFIFDMRQYYDQKFGPVTFHFKAEPSKVDELLKKYIDPDKYAFCDFDKISDVTLGDIMKSGKRYILINEAKAYKGSVDCPCILPWDKKVFGSKAADFAKGTIRVFDENSTDGFYWFQTQQTPNLGTDIGVTTPRALDTALRPYFPEIIDSIATDKNRLEKVNIIAGDFMTFDYMKVNKILRLNLLKNYVRDEAKTEYEEGLDK